MLGISSGLARAGGKAAVVAALLASAACAPRAQIAGPHGAGPVAVARSEDEARRAIEKALPGVDGRLLLVSPNDHLSTLVLPLRRSGALKELVAVLPYDNALGEAHLEQMRAFLGRAGLPEGDQRSLRLDDGAIRGVIEGMPVALRALPAIPKTNERRLVVLDAAFPAAIIRNALKTPMVNTAWKLVLTLRDGGATGGDFLLLDTVGRPDFPLAYGYLPALLREMIASPETFTAGPPEKWRILAAAEESAFFAQYADAMALFKEYLARSPGDASACYRIASMALRDLDVEMSLQWLNRAVDAEPLYKRAYLEAAGYLYGKDLVDGAERILLAALSRFPKEPAFATNLAALYLSRGEALLRGGDGQGAREYFRMAAGIEGAEPQMRERARALAEGAAPGSGK